MAITNHGHVGKAMDLLCQGLAPFAARVLPNDSGIEIGCQFERQAAQADSTGNLPPSDSRPGS